MYEDILIRTDTSPRHTKVLSDVGLAATVSILLGDCLTQTLRLPLERRDNK